MNKITYKVVKHDGGWAYEANGTYSEKFATREAARKAAKLAASEQAAPGETTPISYEDKGRWHDEVAAGTDRPKTAVKVDAIGPMRRKYDAIVIGGGQAGPSLAARFAGAGKSVAIIERHLFGGTCVNAGCTPTKTLIASARIAYDARRARDYGIEIPTASVAVNMRAVQARKERIVDASRTGLENWLRGMQNCSIYKGSARFESPRSVSVDGEVLTSEQIFINVGGRPRIPAFPGIENVAFLTSTSLLELEDLPAHLVIIGGSYVGLEFAQMYRRFGSDVTVVEKEPGLLPHEDPEVATAIQTALEAEGVRIRVGAECIQLAHQAESVTANVHCSTGSPQITGSHVLIAVVEFPTPTTWALRMPAWKQTTPVSSRSMMN